MSTHQSTANAFERLRDYLAALPRQQYDLEMTLAEIEAVLGHRLPDSALEGACWLKNKDAFSEPQAAWLDAGFGVSFFAP